MTRFRSNVLKLVGTIAILEIAAVASDALRFGTPPRHAAASDRDQKTEESDRSWHDGFPSATAAPAARPFDGKSILVVTDTPEEAHLLQVLQEKISFSFEGSLTEGLQVIARKYEIPIYLDLRSLEDEGLSGNEEVRLTIEGIPLKNVLKLLLGNVSGVPLTYVVEERVLKIVSQTEAQSHMLTRVYHVLPLMPFEPAELIKTVTFCTGGAWYREAPGQSVSQLDDSLGGRASLLNQCLVVRQTQAIQEEVETLLNSLLLAAPSRPDASNRN